MCLDILIKRVRELINGEEPLVDTEETDVFKIALQEYEEGLLM